MRRRAPEIAGECLEVLDNGRKVAMPTMLPQSAKQSRGRRCDLWRRSTPKRLPFRLITRNLSSGMWPSFFSSFSKSALTKRSRQKKTIRNTHRPVPEARPFEPRKRSSAQPRSLVSVLDASTKEKPRVDFDRVGPSFGRLTLNANFSSSAGIWCLQYRSRWQASFQYSPVSPRSTCCAGEWSDGMSPVCP